MKECVEVGEGGGGGGDGCSSIYRVDLSEAKARLAYVGG